MWRPERPDIELALYRIAETASAAHDMGEFYASIHAIVGELMYAENFYVALYDEDRQRVIDESVGDVLQPPAARVKGNA